MKCEECEKECQERFRQVVRMPKDAKVLKQNLTPEEWSKVEMVDHEIMVCKDCWNQFDIMYKKNLDFVVYEAENLMKKAGNELSEDAKKKLQEILDQRKNQK